MSKPDNQVNELHLREPQPGDFRHERFCPYHIVLAVTPDGVVITDKTKPDGSSHYTFDLEAAKEITHEEHARAVRYSSGNGFAADVVPARAAGSVREWKASGSKYIPIAEQQAAPHSGEALIDTNKMREQFSNEFDAWLDGYEKDREANGWMPLEPYVRKHMRNAFVASREAVVVVLPKQYGIGGMASDYRDQGIEECRDAIRAQGLRVAP